MDAKDKQKLLLSMIKKEANHYVDKMCISCDDQEEQRKLDFVCGAYFALRIFAGLNVLDPKSLDKQIFVSEDMIA